MALTVQNRLPATFRSLYRLFLRTSSATVLHHKQARRSLRERWRPVFDAGAKITNELRDKPKDASEAWVQGREDWLKNWNERMDNTLALLYTASQSRGLPHQLSRNLAFMLSDEKDRLVTKYKRAPKWNPASPQRPNPQQSAKTKASESFQLNAPKALAEVLRMAEAGSQLTLGRNVCTPRRSVRLWSQG